MSYAPKFWKPETRPNDCWDWITPEDVCRHALAAYYLARDAVRQPPGRRFVEPDGTRWAGREVFGDNLAAVFELRLKTDGYHLGIEPDWANDAKQLQAWTAPRTWHPDELHHLEESAPVGQSEHPKVSTKSHAFGGMGARPHASEAKTEPALNTPGTLKANPEGLAQDAGKVLQNRAALPCAP